MGKNDYFYALGRRKSATARVRLTSGKGQIAINGKDLNEYFSGSAQLIKEVTNPLRVVEKSDKFNASVVVSGGGLSGQASAISLGIAKSLVAVNEDFKSTLKKAELLSRDPREKERKKFGLKGARKKRQFTKR